MRLIDRANTVFRLSYWTVAALALLGCRGTRLERPAVTTRDSAGITIVENRRPAWNLFTRWTIGSHPILQVDTLATNGAELPLGDVWDALRLSDGSVVVSILADRVIWFDARGRFRAMARFTSAAPGDFDMASSWLIRMGGDTVAVFGGARARKEPVFGPTGHWVRYDTLPVRLTQQMKSADDCGLYPLPGHAWLECIKPSLAAGSYVSPHPRVFRDMTLLVRFQDRPERLDTVIHELRPDQFGTPGPAAKLLVGAVWSMPYRAVSAGTSPVIAHADNPEYSIALWRPGKGVTRIVRRLGARKAVSAADRTEVSTFGRLRWGENAATESLLAQLPIPDSLPAVAGLAIGPAGELLVTRDKSAPLDGHTDVDVFSPEGRWLGTLAFPGRFTVRDVGSNYILGTRVDATRGDIIEVYRLSRSIASRLRFW